MLMILVHDWLCCSWHVRHNVMMFRPRCSFHGGQEESSFVRPEPLLHIKLTMSPIVSL